MTHQNTYQNYKSNNSSHFEGYYQTNYKGLFIKCLPNDMLQEDLEFLFSIAGQIKSARIRQKSRNQNQLHTWGYVTYKSSTDAEKAFRKFNQRKLGSTILNIQYQKSQRRQTGVKKTEKREEKNQHKRHLQKQQDDNCYQKPKKYVKVDQNQNKAYSKAYKDDAANWEKHNKSDKFNSNKSNHSDYKTVIQGKQKQDKCKQFTYSFDSRYKKNYQQKKHYDEEQTVYHTDDDRYDY